MLVGDKIRIQDDTLSKEINYIDTIISPTRIKTLNESARTFFKNRNPQIKVLRDSFSNTHEHQIRSNEVEKLSISAYLVNGYPLEHSHRVLALIPNVSSLLERNGEIIAAGSTDKLYNSLDNGQTWQEIVDLNNYLEGADELTGVSTMSLRGGKIMAAASNGNIFVEGVVNKDVVRLRKPR